MKYNFDMIWNGYTTCAENWGMEDETVIFHRIYYVYGGEAYCKLDDRIVRLEHGHLYILPVMHPYTMWHNAKDPLKVLWFHIETDVRFGMGMEDVKIERNTALYSLFDAIKNITDDPDHYEELLEIFAILLGFLLEKIPLNFVSSKRMQSVMTYIDKNYGNPELSVDTLATLVKMNRSSFTRKFKKTFNIAPKQYIYAKRMNKAAQELACGASVYQAGSLVGYLDEKSFSRAFKRYMEVTPSEYRKYRITLP